MFNVRVSVWGWACVAAWHLGAQADVAPAPAGLIPEHEMAALAGQFKQACDSGGSAVADRRSFKNTARRGLALVAAAPDAANRFDALAIVLQCQKKLLALEGMESNRAAVFETCAKLVDAPDAHAEARLEADLLLSDRNLSEKNATLDERANALAKLLERYRDTPAEAKSLLMGALIVQKLDAPELEEAIYYALDERYSDDHEVIEFRRKFLKNVRLDLTFSGVYMRNDGVALNFPADRMGHMSLMVFWSRNKPGVDDYLAAAKQDLARFAGLVDAFSFNVDGLPDHGESFLREHGLDWTVMQLPGGRQHQAYRTYAQGDPVALLVNEYGLTVVRPEVVHGRAAAVDEARVSDARYMAQLQSLFIGEVLLPETENGPVDRLGPVTGAVARTIQACFPCTPFRHRVTRADALANYRNAEALCRDAIGKHPDAPDVWELRNRRIIALLGMWNLACEPTYLTQAVEEATIVLGTRGEPSAVVAVEGGGGVNDVARERRTLLPQGADVIPRFCLAKAAIRRGSEDPESVAAAFFAGCDGATTGSALAAAIILSLDARARDLYDRYRGMFLNSYGEDPAFYSFSALLRDRYVQYGLLKANHSRRERGTRNYIVAHGQPSPTNALPAIALTKLDGTVLHLPKDTHGKLTYLLFVEPPADPEADFPATLDQGKRRTRNDGIRTVMDYAEALSKAHVNGELNFVAAFLSDDAEHVGRLVATNGWHGEAVLVPGGLKNAMVRQLGIFSADHMPNVFVVRRDGTVAWQASGYKYRSEFGYPFAVLLAMKVHVETCEVETAYEALASGNYREALRIFSGPFAPAEPDRYGWRSSRYHGQALALMGLADWGAALDAIDKAVAAHKLLHFRGRRGRAENWQSDAADVVMNAPCNTLVALWESKIMILDGLGRSEEAGALKKQCNPPVSPDGPNVYSAFEERLVGVRETIKQEIVTP